MRHSHSLHFLTLRCRFVDVEMCFRIVFLLVRVLFVIVVHVVVGMWIAVMEIGRVVVDSEIGRMVVGMRVVDVEISGVVVDLGLRERLWVADVAIGAVVVFVVVIP